MRRGLLAPGARAATLVGMSQRIGVNDEFFAAVESVPTLEEAVDTSRHADVPGDWWVVIADIAGSTEAIARGQYKQVNTVGVACIAAVLNLDRSLALPYMFGGDGATLAIPDRLRARAEAALRGAQRMARDAFGLGLRVGLVRVSELQAQGMRVRASKVRLSPQVDLPVLSGRGWEEAERRTKAGEAVCLLDADAEPAEADFSGFECRWQNVPARKGVKLSLIVLGRSPDPLLNQQAIRETLQKVSEMVGDAAASHPLDLAGLRIHFGRLGLTVEPRVRTWGQGAWARWRYVGHLLFVNLAALYVFFKYRRQPDTVWGRYRRDLIRQSDRRKFDGALRMVLDASAEQVASLRQWLEAQRRAGRLVYGMHQSDAALITCIVHSYDGRHVHFVDGADGGYALAAREMKAQLQDVRRT